jgi:ParB-like chromosome segregation protein Spo0J
MAIGCTLLKIPVTCKGSKSVALETLQDFQGNLKTLQLDELEKLKRSILKYGFSFPVFVWKDSILDGHQRLFALKELLKEDHTIGNIPVVEIQAKNKTEAAEKLLLINSRYAEIEYDGLQKFIDENQIDLDAIIADLSIPDIDLSEFMAESNQDDDAEYEEREGFEYQILIKCEDEENQKNTIDKIEKLGIECQPLIL